MIDIDLESIDKKYSAIVSEVTAFRDSLQGKCQELLDLKTQIVSGIRAEVDRVKRERD